MRSLLSSLVLLGAALGGCTFSPGPGNGSVGLSGGAGNRVTGGGGSVGIGTGSGGRGGTNGGGAGNGGGNSGVPSEDANCGHQTNPIQMVPPDLLIILDRSQSMSQLPNGMACAPNCNGMDKWTQMTTAISQVVTQTDTTIRWGLKYFSNSGTCGVNNNVAVPVGNMSGQAISTSIGGTNPGGSTPTRVAVNTGLQYLMGLTDTNPKYILLATDGLPNCMPNNNNTMADDSPGAVAAVAAAAAAGVPTFVVGIGTIAKGQTTLMQLAAAGGRAPAAAPGYFQVNSTADLVTVLQTIQGMVASCTFTIPPPPVPTNVAVHADANSIPKDTSHTNGWDYNGTCTATQTTPCSIQVYGSWCDRIKAKEFKNVEALYGCPGEPPVP